MKIIIEFDETKVRDVDTCMHAITLWSEHIFGACTVTGYRRVGRTVEK